MKTHLVVLSILFVIFAFCGFQTVLTADPKLAEVDKNAGKQKQKGSSKQAPTRKKSSTEVEKQGQQKLLQITQLEAASYNNVINFSVTDYQRLVQKNPRPYDVVMLFNVQQHCKHCGAVETEYTSMVYSFVQSRGKSGTTRGMEKERQVFFGVLYFNNEQEIQQLFKDLGMTTVPYIAVSAQDLKREDKAEEFYKDSDRWLVSASEVYAAQKQIDFVNNQLRTDVKLKVTFFTIIKNNAIILFVLGCLFMLVQKAYNFLLNQWVWFSIAIGVFVICTGGLVYSMLNNMPWFKFERNQYGSVSITEYFMRGSRGQWAGEGYLISVLVTIIGLGYLYLIKISELKQDKCEMRISVIVCLLTLFLLQNMLVMAYRIKSPWYNPSFLPPHYYKSGSLWEDQGNNI